MLKTEMKSAPPSFKLCVEANVRETLVACAVGRRWQNLPLGKQRQRLQPLPCDPVRITNPPCKRNQVELEPCSRGKQACVELRSPYLHGKLPALSFLAGPRALTQHEKVSLSSPAVLNTLQVFFSTCNVISQCQAAASGIIM